MNLNIEGKIALVTGGSHGIGLAIVEELRQEGCIVRSLSRREGCNVLNPNDVQKALSVFHTIDILVNNVGGGGRLGDEDPLLTFEHVWRDIYEKNAMAAILFTMNALPHMLKQKWGRVVTVASIYGKEGGGRPWFNMAKAAEISLMKTLAIHYRGSGVTFNSVAPGPIAIPCTANETEGGTPEEVASVVAFLCSKKASWVNGACIAVDGGESRSF